MYRACSPQVGQELVFLACERSTPLTMTRAANTKVKIQRVILASKLRDASSSHSGTNKQIRLQAEEVLAKNRGAQVRGDKESASLFV